MPWNSSDGSTTCAPRLRRLAHERLGLGDVGRHVGAVGRLDGRDGDRALGHYRGSCWVMQWNEPPPAMPQPSSPREGTPTTLRPGNTACSAASAASCVGGAVDRHDDDAVGDDEVHVRGGRDLAQRVAIEADAGNADDLELAARGIGRALERARRSRRASRRWDRRRRRAPGRRRGRARRSGRCCRCGRRCDRSCRPSSIQMTLRAPNASASAASACRLGPAVAVGIEQRLPRRQDRALAVVVDRAAFEHEVEAADGRAGEARDVVADGGVVGQVVLAAPAVGLEAQRDGAVGRARKDRSGVAQPDVAVARGHELGGSPTAARAEASASAPLTSRRTGLPLAQARAPAPPRRGAAPRGRRSIRRHRPATPSRSPSAAPTPAERRPWLLCRIAASAELHSAQAQGVGDDADRGERHGRGGDDRATAGGRRPDRARPRRSARRPRCRRRRRTGSGGCCASSPRLRRRARTMPVRSPLSSVTPALSMATSVPVPMAMPTSAAASAGASLTPSPAMATTRPSRLQLLDDRALLIGQHLGLDLGDAELGARRLPPSCGCRRSA